MRRVHNRKQFWYCSTILFSLLFTPIFTIYLQTSYRDMGDGNSVINLVPLNIHASHPEEINNIHSNLIIDDVYPKTAILNDNKYDNWWVEAIGATNLEYNGSGVIVAILDTGIFNSTDYNVTENIWFNNGESSTEGTEDEYGHGTHVAGIVGGNGASSDGKYRGIAPGVELYNVKISNITGGILEKDVVNAIEWCIGNNVDIISMSFGYSFPSVYDKVTEALSKATKEGITCIASAGNSGPEYFTGGSPAAGIDVISVGATNRDNRLASFSSLGPTTMDVAFPDIVAPGVNIISAEAHESLISRRMRYIGDYFDYPGEIDYIPLSGTSMACPMVAGAAAILLEAFPGLTPETVRIALMEGATKLLDNNDAEYLKSGAGLINISASLDFLENITENINNVAKILPEFLPIKPYDLLNFPGDHQKFNLSIVSGKNNTYDIEIPSIPGVSFILETSTLHFNDAGVNFTALDIMIDFNATPSIRSDYINLTSDGELYDSIEISLEIRMPEYKILMESYHGLNDWLPEISFYQMGFYEAMNAISKINISIDYLMEYWTPNYNKNTDNSILTEERLSQYDLVVLQNPILPYNPLEINNLVDYFNNGGNILFLGTLYQHLCRENVNDLFSRLGSGIHVNEENVKYEKWLGLGAEIYSIPAIGNTTHQIFENVPAFLWSYGCSFTCSSDAESIATSFDDKTVVVAYNGTISGKGKIVAFGDLHWLFNGFSDSYYYQYHLNLLTNLIDYYFPKNEISYSININIPSEEVSNPILNLSVYVKNQTSKVPVNTSDLEYNLSVVIENNTTSFPIIMIIHDDGIVFNDTINLSSFFVQSNNTLTIKVNYTVGSTTYTKSIKFLYLDQSSIPMISDFTSSNNILNRNDTITFNVSLSQNDSIVVGYMGIYTYSYYNSKQTINKTLNFTYNEFNYLNKSQINETDPSGYGIMYILANSTTNYLNPRSPRILFQIVNNDPKIIDSTSTCDGKILSSTQNEDGAFIDYISSRQGSSVGFDIYTEDIEDNSSNIRVSVNLLICFIINDTIVPIVPHIHEVAEFSFSSGCHSGSFVIPYSMAYSSIEGTKRISTFANYRNGYVGLFIITIIDSEGGVDDFYLLIFIEPGVNIELIIYIIIIAIISLMAITMVVLYVRSRRKSREPRRTPYNRGDYYHPSSSYEYNGEEEHYSEGMYSQGSEIPMSGGISCPHCGEIIDVPKKFCPHCGKSVLFK